MADLKISTEAVVSVADGIKQNNVSIRDGFTTVKNAVRNLKNYWDSPAATSGFSKFDNIEKTYCDTRYKVVDSYVSFLYQQVGEGYVNTEEVNLSLADQYKELAAQFK